MAYPKAEKATTKAEKPQQNPIPCNILINQLCTMS
jgi:hypothetical protein